MMAVLHITNDRPASVVSWVSIIPICITPGPVPEDRSCAPYALLLNNNLFLDVNNLNSLVCLVGEGWTRCRSGISSGGHEAKTERPQSESECCGGEIHRRHFEPPFAWKTVLTCIRSGICADVASVDCSHNCCPPTSSQAFSGLPVSADAPDTEPHAP